MPTFMHQFSYTSEAMAALVASPEDRSVPVGEVYEELGARVLSFYYCFGDYDGVAITEAPDETTALAAVLACIAPGHLRSVKTTLLLNMQQAQEAMRKAGRVVLPAPKK